MFDKQRLYEIENEVDKQIQNIKEARELETKAFVDGMKKGAELMFKAVYWEREHCTKCSAKEYCDYYQDILESEREQE